MKRFATRLEMIYDLPEGSSGVEVGVLRGDWSMEMLGTGKVAKLLLVDSWKFYEEYGNDVANVDQAAQDTIYAYVQMRFHDMPNVEVMRKSSMDAAISLWGSGKKFDFLFLDSNHTYNYVGGDLCMWSAYTDKILCHDYCENEESKAMGFGVKAAVDDWLKQNPQWKMTAITGEKWATCRLEKI